MNNLLHDFLTAYSYPTIIVAVIVCAVSLSLNGLFIKLPKTIRIYIPFIISITLYYAYDMIFILNDFFLRGETLYAGILSGSISLIISSSIRKISQGKPIGLGATVLLIEGILYGYIDESILTKTACEIERAISLSTNQALTEKQIIKALKSSNKGLSTADICHLVKLILVAVENIKKN